MDWYTGRLLGGYMGTDGVWCIDTIDAINELLCVYTII